MLIRCAWCKTMTGNKPPYGGKYDREITDGICDDCLKKYFPREADKIIKGVAVTTKTLTKCPFLSDAPCDKPTCSGCETYQKALTANPEDKDIADNMRDFWANLNAGSIDWRG